MNPPLKGKGPRFVRYFGPVLRALRDLGGSARPREVTEHVAIAERVSEEERSETLESGSSRFNNLVAWARFYLSKGGYIDSSRHGVWSLTDLGRQHAGMTHPEALKLFKELHRRMTKATAAAAAEAATGEGVGSDESPSDETYQDQVLKLLGALPPRGFERFCQRVLREAGFQEVTVTGRSGDGGIDGIGILQVNPLVSFKVLFQCKRYKGTVSPSQVRDFRGAMGGRADKGIIITTGEFTAEARREAVRDGVPPIELVDGERLVEMLRELELGLRPVQNFEVDTNFFSEFAVPTT